MDHLSTASLRILTGSWCSNRHDLLVLWENIDAALAEGTASKENAGWQGGQMIDVLQQVAATIAAEFSFRDKNLSYGDYQRVIPTYWQSLPDVERQKWLDSVRIGLSVLMAAAAGSDLPPKEKAVLAGWLEDKKGPGAP